MTPDVTLDPWLRQFPDHAQPLVTAWFAYGAGQKPPTAEALLTIVQRLITNKLDWSVATETRELCSLTLLAMTHARAGALGYATTLLTQKEMR